MKDNENLKELIKKGLYQDNLECLIELCKGNLKEEPLTFFVLINIFERLASEYENQAVPSNRYNEVNALAPLLISAIDKPSKKNVSNLIKAYLEVCK